MNNLIWIKIDLTGKNQLKCIVEDDGIGREQSRKIYASQRYHTSKGSSIVTERTDLLGIQMKYVDLFNNNEPSGTRVELIITI